MQIAARRAGLAARPDAGGRAGRRPAARRAARRPPRPAQLSTVEVRGEAEPERELSLPYRGQRLRGDALHRRLVAWVDAGVIEPSCADAVRTVADHPEWLALPGRTVAVLGAGAEMGPLTALLRWGARVAAVDLPRPAIWPRVLDTARRGAGTLLVPVGAPGRRPSAGRRRPGRRGPRGGRVAGRPARGTWCWATTSTPTAPTNVRVSVAVDALDPAAGRAPATTGAGASWPPPPTSSSSRREAVDALGRRVRPAVRPAKLLGRPLRTLSAGRLLRRAYVPGADPGINDSLVPQQGPNYALAKRLQRWRASVARAAGSAVSMNVAPPTRTRSVVKNRALAAAYAGAHRFGVEVFEPATSNVLMAALLVHDLHTGGGPSTRTRGRTRRTRRRTAGCGAPPTPRAARSAWPRCWALGAARG